jgi:ATP-dependent DNA ligase
LRTLTSEDNWERGFWCIIPPQLATLVDEPPKGDDWVHEIKYDGYRTQLILNNGEVRALSRRGADWSAKYHPIICAADRDRPRAAPTR